MFTSLRIISMKQKTNRTQCLEGISLILIFENSNNNAASRGSNKKSRQASKYKAIWIKNKRVGDNVKRSWKMDYIQ